MRRVVGWGARSERSLGIAGARSSNLFQTLQLFHVRQILVASSRLLVGDECRLADVRDVIAVQLEGLRALEGVVSTSTFSGAMPKR